MVLWCKTGLKNPRNHAHMGGGDDMIRYEIVIKKEKSRQTAFLTCGNESLFLLASQTEVGKKEARKTAENDIPYKEIHIFVINTKKIWKTVFNTVVSLKKIFFFVFEPKTQK